MGETLESAAHEHFECNLGVADPAHAVREPRGAEAVLAEEVPFAAASEHLIAADVEVRDANLAVVAAPGHSVDVADNLPALGGKVDHEGGVAGLRRVGVFVCAGDEDGEVRSFCAGDEPLMSVDNPVVAVLHGLRLDERGVGAGDFGLGHGEAGAGAALGERAQVLLLLLGSSPVE